MESSPENFKLIVGMLQGRQNSLGAVLSIQFSCFVDMNKIQ